MIELAIITACILIAFSIGSNDTSNAFGISIGCGLLKFRTALILLLIFVFIGVSLQGYAVMRTVGKELVGLSGKSLALSLTMSAIVIILSNWRRFPLSSHQVIIGSLTGSALALGLPINYYTLLKIVLSWILSPLSSFFISIAIYKILEKTLVRYSVFVAERILSVLLLISAILIAYNTGANELATAVGSVVYYGILDTTQAGVIGAFSLFFGALALSHRVVETVGKGITALDVISGFSAQFGAGLSVWVFTTLGMPVSTTYCIIGGISGVGFLKSVGTVKLDLLRRIALSWVTAPALSFIICFALGKVI
jgi:PiT family inorganic phosphate transporter